MRNKTAKNLSIILCLKIVQTTKFVNGIYWRLAIVGRPRQLLSPIFSQPRLVKELRTASLVDRVSLYTYKRRDGELTRRRAVIIEKSLAEIRRR